MSQLGCDNVLCLDSLQKAITIHRHTPSARPSFNDKQELQPTLRESPSLSQVSTLGIFKTMSMLYEVDVHSWQSEHWYICLLVVQVLVITSQIAPLLLNIYLYHKNERIILLPPASAVGKLFGAQSRARRAFDDCFRPVSVVPSECTISSL